jgi:hypothetical protein
LLTLLTAVAIASAALSPIVVSATAPSPAPSAKASPKAKDPKDPCGNAKSKWQRSQCEEFNSSAPGDEYFGRMKISYLGIDNTYKDGVISAGAYSTDPRLISKLDFATEALERWAAKYPNDPQLARSYYFGVEVLRRIYTQTEQQRAWEFIQLLTHKYGNTYFGKIMKADTTHGFTEHWFALAQVCPTALPSGAMPENAPVATPSPTPAPGQPNIEIITPPCVPPSPTPEEYPGPSSSPGPMSSTPASPVPSPSKHP